MSLLDKNKLFFGLIHYILSEQKNVDWLLKTSIADLLGVNLQMNEISYSTNDIMKNMIDFIYDIKPYHTKFNKYLEKFIQKENVNTNIEDTVNNILKVRYDAITTSVDNLIMLYINNKKYYYWQMNQTYFEWGSKETYDQNDLVKYDDKIYKITKTYTPTTSEFVFDPYIMEIVPYCVYTLEQYPTLGSKLYINENMNMEELLGYSIKKIEPNNVIDINNIDYKLNLIKNMFSNKDIVNMYNTHKANRLCLSGLYLNNKYMIVQSENEKLFIKSDEINVGSTVYKFIDEEENYDETNTYLNSRTLQYKMVKVGIIDSIEYNEESTRYLIISVLFNNGEKKNYKNYYINDNDYILYGYFSINEPDYNRIKCALNANFKGITVDGGQFTIDNYGYDEYVYDRKVYDSPSIEVDYCMIKFTETVEGYGEVARHFIDVGEKSFSYKGLNISKITVQLKRNNQAIKVLDSSEYIRNSDIITLVQPLSKYDELYISDGTNILIYYAHPFVESDNETLMHKRIDLNDDVVYLELPSDDYKLFKYIVHIENEANTYGRTQLFASKGDYFVKDDKIAVYNLKENDHIIISSYDYQYLYDKIYSYDDKIGRSNNTVILNGEGMLRPYNEANRTDELIASSPIDGIMYLENKEIDGVNRTADIKRIDYKNELKFMSIEMPSAMRIEGFVQDEETGLTSEIILNDAILLKNNIPGKIFVLHNKNGVYVPGELIEYQDIKDDKTLIGIKRAREGSPLYIGVNGEKRYNEMLTIGDYVYNAHDTRWSTDEKHSLSVDNNVESEIYDIDYWTVENIKRVWVQDKIEKCSFDKVGYTTIGDRYVFSKSYIINYDYENIPNEEELIVDNFEFNCINKKYTQGLETLIKNEDNWKIYEKTDIYNEIFTNEANDTTTNTIEIKCNLKHQRAIYSDNDISVEFEYKDYIINGSDFEITYIEQSSKEGYYQSNFEHTTNVSYFDNEYTFNDLCKLFKEIPEEPIIPEDYITSKEFKNAKILIDNINKKVNVEVDYVVNHSILPTETTHLANQFGYSINGISNWNITTDSTNCLYDNLVQLSTSQTIIDDKWKYESKTIKYQQMVRFNGGNVNNEWTLNIPDNIRVNIDNKEYKFADLVITNDVPNNTISNPQELDDGKKYPFTSKLTTTISVSNTSDELTSTVNGNILVPYPNYKPDWGKFTSAVGTVAQNQAKDSWLYTWSIHFEHGTLAVIVGRNATSATIDTNLFTTCTDSRLNGAAYKNGWQNAIAEDVPGKFMQWINETYTVGLDVLQYTDATFLGWNNGYNTVKNSDFSFELSEENTVLTVRKKGLLFAKLKTDYNNGIKMV